MTPEAQRIAIAEACGWIKVGRGLAGLGGYPLAGYEKHPLPSPEDHSENWRMRYGKAPGNQWFPLPDYLNDLNAMHEAENLLDAQQQVDYSFRLHRQGNLRHLQNDWFVAHATATQRAEAFLRTIGKWPIA